MFTLANTLAAAGFVPARLEAAMLAACRAAGASAWYVKDDFAGAYQDSTGSTAISAIGQPVGRINDSSAATNVTQATAGNRPVITRIPRKLGPELVVNGSGDNVTGWVSGTAPLTSVGGEFVLASDGGSYPSATCQSFATTIGSTYVLTGSTKRGTGAWNVKLRARSSSNAELVASGAVATTSAVIHSLPFTATTAQSKVQVYADNGTTTAGDTLVFDNISVREVLEWSYALTFDGTNDSLATGASVIGATLTQPYTMIAWGKVGATGIARSMLADGLRGIGVSSSAKARVTHTGPGVKDGGTTLLQGQSVILEATWDGATSSLYLNGSPEFSSALSAPSGTLYPSAIGQFGAASSYWNEAIGGCVVCPAVMTDAQRLAVRKFAAAQMGLTL